MTLTMKPGQGTHRATTKQAVVEIVVPVYNEAAGITPTLEALAAQQEVDGQRRDGAGDTRGEPRGDRAPLAQEQGDHHRGSQRQEEDQDGVIEHRHRIIASVILSVAKNPQRFTPANILLDPSLRSG